MRFPKKIAGLLLAISLSLIAVAPSTFAQSVLDDIKGRLESDGITVLDYSTPENAWGSLPTEWIMDLSDNFNGIEEIAGRFEAEFIGEDALTAMRRQKLVLEAQKSQMTDADEIASQENIIERLNEEIEELKNEIKDGIRDDIIGESGLNKGEGVNLIFNEIDFYYNYNKWGSLPSRIVSILETETDYEGLQHILNTSEIVGEDDAGIRTENLTEMIEEFESYPGLSRDDAELIVDSILILQSSGESQINQMGRVVANAIKNLAGALAVMWIVIAGVRLIFAQGDENTITEQKKALIYGVIGLAAILLMDRMISVIYGAPGEIRNEFVRDAGFTAEVYGVINFIKAVIGMIAIFFIVTSGIKMIAAQGEEDNISNQKKSLVYIAIGLILIAINEVLVKNIFIIPTEQSDQISQTNVTNIINTIGTVLQFILGFVGLITFGVLVYGGANLIMHYGNDDQVEKSKKIIKNAVIGILVILSAYTIVASLVIFR